MIEAFGIDKQNKWIDIITRFKDYDVYYLPQYTKAFSIHGDGEPLLIYYESGNTRAANVVMKRDISDCAFFPALDKKAIFDISTPYGYGGFMLEGDGSKNAVARLDKEYGEYCRSENIVSEFVRFHPLLRNHSGLESMYEVTELGRTISMDLSSIEVMRSNIETKALKQIEKVREFGFKVSNGNTKELYQTFQEMYDKTMDRDNAKQYYYFGKDFYHSVMRDLKDNATIFYAAIDDEIEAMNIVLYCNGKMHSHLQGSGTNHMRLSPTSLMRYESAVWGCENGIGMFHIGGGVGSKEDSLYAFKKKFNKNSDNHFVIGKKIFDMGKYEDLLQLRKKDPGFEPVQNFFPVYRAEASQ